MKFGFSTGSIALDDVQHGLEIASLGGARAIELSALREEELDPLLRSLDAHEHDLSRFDYIAFHAPSKRENLSEDELVAKLQRVAERGWAIILHPDIISDFSAWRRLGRAVCIENMDKRKRIGRTAAQLQEVFSQLPEATFCFDIGHARQIDPTMQEAEAILRSCAHRLRQVHMSFVNSQSRHERLNFECIQSFRRVAHWLDSCTPIILETPVEADEVDEEILTAEKVFAGDLAVDGRHRLNANRRQELLAPTCEVGGG